MNERRPEGDLTPVEKFSIRQFREAGMSIQQLSSYFNVHMATIHRALAEMRKKFGAETLPRNRRQLARPMLQSNLRDANTQVDHAEKDL
jgi:IS30 family transposase